MVQLFNLLLIVFFTQSLASDEYISIKDITSKANLRKGPGDWYPIKWIIETPSLPLKIIEKGDRFNKVELHDGTQGWLSIILTSKRNTLIVTKDANLEDKTGNVKAKVLKNNIIKEFNCNLAHTPDFCRVKVKSNKGFINKIFLWGFKHSQNP